MKRDIDIKNRVVNFYDVDTGEYEEEIVKYLDKKMLVKFHSVSFNNSNYVFTSSPSEQTPNSITVSGYRKRLPSEKSSVVIE